VQHNNANSNSVATVQHSANNPIQVSNPQPILKYNTTTTTTTGHHPQQLVGHRNPQLQQVQQKEFLNLCENSSAYESSEDTGVGGLSETEFISGHDIIGNLIFFFQVLFKV
jgi:hypothetical protein